MWVADCERRWLLTGDRNERHIAGVKKKAASAQTTFFAGVDFKLVGASQGSTTGGISRSSSPSLLAFYNESPAVSR
jgi:hypothetical protein